jgi:hypothetical protein
MTSHATVHVHRHGTTNVTIVVRDSMPVHVAKRRSEERQQAIHKTMVVSHLLQLIQHILPCNNSAFLPKQFQLLSTCNPGPLGVMAPGVLYYPYPVRILTNGKSTKPISSLIFLMYSLVSEIYADIVAHLFAGAIGCLS